MGALGKLRLHEAYLAVVHAEHCLASGPPCCSKVAVVGKYCCQYAGRSQLCLGLATGHEPYQQLTLATTLQTSGRLYLQVDIGAIITREPKEHG